MLLLSGKWEVEAPVKNGLNGDLGLVLKSKAKHAAISARLDRPFKFIVKPLVVQYEVILQEGQECGGAYIKLLSQGKHTADLRQFHDKTPYTIMFGPDKCGNDHKVLEVSIFVCLHSYSVDFVKYSLWCLENV